MWLLDTTSLEVKEVVDSNNQEYAILSYIWRKEEVSFLDMQMAHEVTQTKAGFAKVLDFCRIAKAHSYRYGWVDTCCIDKRNNADLSEAINSMFNYYRNAGECLIYLSDVPRVVQDVKNLYQQLDSFRDSRWFTRGWNLQELLAPKARVFYSANWSQIDDDGGLLGVVSAITGINLRILQNRNLLSAFCTTERISWASKRQTTRNEDIAYSLMGLFNIHMPVLYGEGSTSAFRRLQEKIIRTSFDQSIFAWRGNYESSGLLAKLPSDFEATPLLGLWSPITCHHSQ